MSPILRRRLRITKAVKAAIRSPYAFPGGYPISIILDDGEAICPACAKAEWHQVAHDTIKGWTATGWSAQGAEVIWEGDDRCANCNTPLAAYGVEEEA